MSEENYVGIFKALPATIFCMFTFLGVGLATFGYAYLLSSESFIVAEQQAVLGTGMTVTQTFLYGFFFAFVTEILHLALRHERIGDC